MTDFERCAPNSASRTSGSTPPRTPALVDWLAGAPAREAATYADRWMNVSRHGLSTYAELRDPSTRWPRRIELLEHLHTSVRMATGDAGNRAHPDEDTPWD